MAKDKKITWKKKMVNSDYIGMIAYVQGKDIPVIEDVEEGWYGQTETRKFRTTREEKEKMEEYFDNIIGGISLEAAIAAIPRKKKPFTPPVLTQTISAPVQVQEQTSINTTTVTNSNTVVSDEQVKKDEPTATDNQQYKILTREERWEWANSFERTKEQLLKHRNIAWFEWTEPVEKEKYPFIIDLNKPATLDNVDGELIYYMVEHGLISGIEVLAVLANTGGGKLFEMKPSEIYPKTRWGNLKFMFAMEVACNWGIKYLELLEEPEPTKDELLTRFARYLKYWDKQPLSSNDIIELKSTFETFEIVDNKIHFIDYDDECGGIYEEKFYEYDNEDDLRRAMYCLYNEHYYVTKGAISYDKEFDIFGKKISPRKHVEDLFKKYPHGFEGKKFYHTRLEAYNDGQENEVMSIKTD